MSRLTKLFARAAIIGLAMFGGAQTVYAQALPPAVQAAIAAAGQDQAALLLVVQAQIASTRP